MGDTLLGKNKVDILTGEITSKKVHGNKVDFLTIKLLRKK